MSRLILGVLASVAEFERDLIRELTRLGMAKARAAGKRISLASSTWAARQVVAGRWCRRLFDGGRQAPPSPFQ